MLLTCVFPNFFWIKIGSIKDFSAGKISGLDGMPGNNLEKKMLTKNANKKKFDFDADFRQYDLIFFA